MPETPWPPELAEVFAASVTAEFATLTRAGAPVTAPTTPYVGAGGRTIDVSTGLTYPAKAERARRNPKVCLLFADPLGPGMADRPVAVVQGRAAVRDTDLQANTDRYVALSSAKLPSSTKGQPKFVLRRLAWYYARIWIEVTPERIRWWPNRDLGTAPQEWRAGADTALPASDPAPPGSPPPPWLPAPVDWPPIAVRMAALPFADLTTVDDDGYPLCLPALAVEPAGGEMRVRLGPGTPPLADGPACLTAHGHAAEFTGQENHTLVGQVRSDADGAVLVVERALPDWSLAGGRARMATAFLANGRRLRPRLRAESTRRGQPVPKVRFPD